MNEADLVETDLLETLLEHKQLSDEQAQLVSDTQAAYGGTLLRTLEYVLTDAEVTTLWEQMSTLVGRKCYSTLREIESLEQPIKRAGGWEPLLSRKLSGRHLALAHRTEWDVLCLLSVNPVIDVTEPELWNIAREVSPTGEGRVRASILPPVLFRRCYALAYPESYYGKLTLIERLSIRGLCPLGKLAPYHQDEEQAVFAALITEQDYAQCLAEHLELPLYDYAKPDIAWQILPQDLIRQYGILPLRLNGDHIEILTTRAPTDQMTQQLRRQGGRDVNYHITTPTVIKALLSQRNHA